MEDAESASVMQILGVRAVELVCPASEVSWVGARLRGSLLGQQERTKDRFLSFCAEVDTGSLCW